ncbi:GNAT family N-acetyltransferase [Ectobacillus ponti]|uniref:GNAT family N-acetyltransferase n=1 Tax=Ectobacillus ponti TaxID=2961894 RepID=A0AA41X3U2_9BACI|nr:GNAT family N-acetyltransferase [Ectobacillus ponti]MCP8968444.1 GNAT family N-acetyltransferase [Ectobacillus ponti]
MIVVATAEDAYSVHEVMMAAFEEYRHIDVPSSALEETIESIRHALSSGKEGAVLYMQDNTSVASARFQLREEHLYFSRLSVRPEAHGKGVAKAILLWLEKHAREHGKEEILCQVRMSVPQNIALYRSVGYEVYQEEVVVKPNGSEVLTCYMKKRF